MTPYVNLLSYQQIDSRMRQVANAIYVCSTKALTLGESINILYIFSIMMGKNNDVFPVSHYDGILVSLPLIVMTINLCGL